MSRITSREAIKQLAESGQISSMQWEVLEAMRRSSRTTMTARELMLEGCCNGAWKRLSELKRKSLVVEDGIKKCAVTGRSAIAWKLGDGTVPVKKEKRWSYNPLMVTIQKDGDKALEFCCTFEQNQDYHSIGKAIAAMLNRRFP